MWLFKLISAGLVALNKYRKHNNAVKYDINGFDIDGFDYDGYDKNRFDRQGYNKQGECK